MSDRNFLRLIQKAITDVMDDTGNQPANKQTGSPIIKSFIEEEQIAVEVVYKPDEKDAHGEWMSEETIRKGYESFERNEVAPNLFHLVDTDRFEFGDSNILEEDTTYEVAGEAKTLKKGTWIMETHYTDKELWELKKSGELGGLSLGGYGLRNEETGEITNLRFSEEEYLQTLEGDE
ncbi:hypothetical protein [Vibrio phage RYC]|nr:hypothetical protein [Vibrio phage RYC]